MTKMVRGIGREALKERIDASEDLVLLDARTRDSYSREHRIQAVSLPVDEAEKRAVAILPEKDRLIVTSCGSYECPASTKLAKKLEEMGYSNVLDYKGGIKDWKEAGYPTVTG